MRKQHRTWTEIPLWSWSMLAKQHLTLLAYLWFRTVRIGSTHDLRSMSAGGIRTVSFISESTNMEVNEPRTVLQEDLLLPRRSLFVGHPRAFMCVDMRQKMPIGHFRLEKSFCLFTRLVLYNLVKQRQLTGIHCRRYCRSRWQALYHGAIWFVWMSLMNMVFALVFVESERWCID